MEEMKLYDLLANVLLIGFLAIGAIRRRAQRYILQMEART